MEFEQMDRLEIIKQNNERRKKLFKDGIPNDIKFSDVDWMISEIERLRNVIKGYRFSEDIKN